MKILDCTLRDGGYYNRWDFDKDIVDRYLSSIKNASVDVVELGFRSQPKKLLWDLISIRQMNSLIN